MQTDKMMLLSEEGTYHSLQLSQPILPNLFMCSFLFRSK